MRIKVVALGFLVVVLLGAMTGVGHASRQEGEGVIFTPASTPISGVDCGGGIEVFSEAGITLPAGLAHVFACGKIEGTTLTASTVSTIASGTVLSNDTADEPVGLIRQKGAAHITILQGELKVVLFSNCATKPGCTDAEPGSKAEIYVLGPDNAVSVIVLDPNSDPVDPVTLDPEGRPMVTLIQGQSMVLVNVTVSFTAGQEGALVGATGSYDLNAGEGCITRCWQFP